MEFDQTPSSMQLFPCPRPRFSDPLARRLHHAAGPWPRRLSPPPDRPQGVLRSSRGAALGRCHHVRGAGALNTREPDLTGHDAESRGRRSQRHRSEAVHSRLLRSSVRVAALCGRAMVPSDEILSPQVSTDTIL